MNWHYFKVAFHYISFFFFALTQFKIILRSSKYLLSKLEWSYFFVSAVTQAMVFVFSVTDWKMYHHSSWECFGTAGVKVKASAVYVTKKPWKRLIVKSIWCVQRRWTAGCYRSNPTANNAEIIHETFLMNENITATSPSKMVVLGEFLPLHVFTVTWQNRKQNMRGVILLNLLSSSYPPVTPLGFNGSGAVGAAVRSS